MPEKEPDEIAFGADDSLSAEFFVWLEEAVTEMRQLVDEFPDDITRGLDSVHRIYDLAHNIKGMGASFDFDLMTEVGVSLCGYLKDIDNDGTVSGRVISSHVRAFEVIKTHKIRGSGGGQGDALTRRLEEIITEEASS